VVRPSSELWTSLLSFSLPFLVEKEDAFVTAEGPPCSCGG